ncbi:hypothetical protein EPUS_00057 [Endocarpon pusillum Z07020]|uniref:Trichothecene 3-O-acetyltransferase-like N-terminal domain-containing protein n=1 Tax=Endocarpon pusillum (strain Z07020 / HMAS-L-300199) TaxID=1263415 RepID=U1HWV7_ENDPU|nr:uncharacterized protein EPUS_00057 [Endocarpon pusillum Z07020]ERF75265.1 hypothetical protein EPUS_00057 [Endocarpon pusillum Z07020]
MLDESIIAPRNTLPGSSDDSAPDSAPVSRLANFITAALLLTIVGQHNTMDMTGQGHIIHLFSKACRNEQFTSEQLSCVNLGRRSLIHLLDNSHKPGSELAHQIVKPTPSHPITNSMNVHPAPPSPPKSTFSPL